MMHRFLTISALATLSFTAQAQLTLPYAGTDSGATISSFQIVKSGTGGRANTLYITNASNTSDVLLASTAGLGRAAYFSINNSANSQVAVRGDSNGSGIGVFGYMSGTGRAGVFRITNPSNTNYALHAITDGSGAALKAQAGSGYAGDFSGQVNIAAAGEGVELLRFSTERPWVFRQIYTGPSASLELFSTIGQKRFQITSSDGANVATFLADGLNSKVGIGTITPGARLESVVPEGTAVAGHATADTDAESVGVAGFASGAVGRGVYGFAKYLGSGVYGEGTGAFGWGVYSLGRSGASGVKAFRIDHPLDPTHKYLLHYSTEMPEPQNAYNGVVTTDEAGKAWVQLPAYFGEINKDPRYQLTVVDGNEGPGFVQVKVARKISENRFMIMTSAPHVEVCWEVKAKRNDLWVRKNGAPIEENKIGKERGKYQHPEFYSQPASAGIKPY